MTYTSHGHHIIGTSAYAEFHRPKIVRCGGIKVCAECKEEALKALPEDSVTAADLKQDLESLTEFHDIDNNAHPSGLPVTYVRRPIMNYEHMFFEGSEDSVRDIRQWLENHNVESAYWPGLGERGPRITFIEGLHSGHRSERECILKAGEHIVQHRSYVPSGKYDDNGMVIYTYQFDYRVYTHEDFQDQFEPSSMMAPAPWLFNDHASH